jgi:preprotein translocase subunit YajC
MGGDTVVSAILWVAAFGVLILLVMRRRKRKMQG